jgi:uncharacterized protein (TIGR00730 family)
MDLAVDRAAAPRRAYASGGRDPVQSASNTSIARERFTQHRRSRMRSAARAATQPQSIFVRIKPVRHRYPNLFAAKSGTCSSRTRFVANIETPNKHPNQKRSEMPPTPPKAYKNLQFLNSRHARTIRILSEYLEPKSRLDYHAIHDTIVFFGSARFRDAEAAAKMLAEAGTAEEHRRAAVAQAGSRYYEEARSLAYRLTKWSAEVAVDGRHFVVCSGGGPGIMEAANRGAHEADGPSVGFNITLPVEQQPNPYITPELSFQFHYFFMRKLWFAYLAKALIVFPGGFGTLDEMMEILTLTQTHKIRKKVLVVIYGREYWDKVLNFDALIEMGTIDESDRELFSYADTPDQAFETLTTWLAQNYSEKNERLS